MYMYTFINCDIETSDKSGMISACTEGITVNMCALGLIHFLVN